MKKIIRFKRSEEGQSLVEFALVLPILMMLILGMIEFGWVLNGQITLTSAAREGARSAVICETEDKAKIDANTAVINSASGSSLTGVSSETFFDANGSAIVNATATIKPIVGLFLHEDISLKSRAEMKIE